MRAPINCSLCVEQAKSIVSRSPLCLATHRKVVMSSTSGRQADLASLAHHSTPHESQRPFRVEHIVSYPHHYGPALTANHRIYPAHPCVQRVPPSHRMVVSALSALFERCPDVVVATSPQFFCAIAGWAVSVATRRPFVFELRDLWPASIVAVGAMHGLVIILVLERVELLLPACY